MSTDINIKKKISIEEEGALLTADVNNINFVGAGVTASTLGNDVTVTVAGSIGGTVYYMNETVTQAPYKEFSSNPTSAVEQVIPATVAGGATATIAAYQTPVGVPNTTVIPAGLWQLFLHFNAGSAGQNWIIRPYVYKRDLGGIETLIFTPDPQIVTGMSTTTTMYTCDGVFPNTVLLTTDRIVVKIDVQNTSGVSQTVNFRTEGSQHYSVAATTLNQAISAGSVTSVSGTAPIVSSGGTTPAISIPQATALVNGYLSSSDWSVFDAKVPATRNLTINGTTYDLSADRTWIVSAASGIFGISDSSGVYTYYTTLTLAMAAATSGQTIEMFADYNETGAVSITMKAGVIIQGNGHSYNHSHASATYTFLFPTNANYYIYNLQVNRTNATAGAYVFYHVAFSPYTVYCNGTTIRTNKGGIWWHFSQPGNVYNLTIEFSGSGDIGIVGSGSNVNNCTIIGTSASSNTLAGQGCVLNNCNVLNRGTGITIGDGYINNTTINSLASAACNGLYGVSNSYIYSATSYGLLLFNGGLCRNSVIISAGSYAATIYNANSRYDNCLLWSTVNNAFYAGLGGDLKFNNCVLLSSASVALNAHSVEATNCTIESLWANAGGHAVAITSTDSVISNCMLRTANTSANAIYAASAFTIKFANNVYANMTTPININITQGITNTHDNQGNILI